VRPTRSARAVDPIDVRCVLVVLGACGEVALVPADAPVEPHRARYVIAAGQHEAEVYDAIPRDPIRGITDVTGRDYELALDRSAIYSLGTVDQYDWNKLPGLSDCDAIDLAVDGAMFGWRWRDDLTPPVLEVTAYANTAGVHLTPEAPLFTLDAAELEAAIPIRYTVAREPAAYRFTAAADLRGRAIAATATLPRRCAGAPLDPGAWAGAFYFGGTTVAPHAITASIHERDHAAD
jgi:hypothetical protein